MNLLIPAPIPTLAFALAATLPVFPASAQPTVLNAGHMDFGLAYDADALKPHIHVHEPPPDGVEFSLEDVVLQVGSAAATTVPARPDFAFLGPPDSPVWILPQSGIPGLPFLGLAAEEIPSGLFQADTLQLTLSSSQGPGDFALYRVDGFGRLTLFMSTGDGVTAGTDRILVTAGTHGHANWAFTSPGDYSLTFVASGTLSADGTLVQSDAATLRFVVIPEPSVLSLLGLGATALILRRRAGSRPRPDRLL